LTTKLPVTISLLENGQRIIHRLIHGTVSWLKMGMDREKKWNLNNELLPYLAVRAIRRDNKQLNPL
jgi:hypothetical protein